MTVPVKDNPDRHVGWYSVGGFTGSWPAYHAPAEGHWHDYRYGALALEQRHEGFGIYSPRWVRLDPMHPWDLDPHMNYEPLGYRKMTEGDL